MENRLKFPLKYATSPDYTGVWDRDENVVFGMITDGRDTPVFREWACQIAMTKHQLKYVVASANALSDVENPYAVKRLLDYIKSDDRDVDQISKLVSEIKFITEDSADDH